MLLREDGLFASLIGSSLCWSQLVPPDRLVSSKRCLKDLLIRLLLLVLLLHNGAIVVGHVEHLNVLGPFELLLEEYIS